MKDDTSTPTSDSGTSPNEFESGKPGTSARTLSEGGIEELRAEGGVFVNAVRATRMPMVLTDPTLPGNPIVFANAAFLKLSGYSIGEVLGQQPHFMNGPDTDARDAARFREMVRSEQDEILETIQYRKNGERFIATVLISAFKDDEGRTLHHFMSWLDVTRRVEAEDEVAELKSTQAALRESDLRHRLLIDTWAQAVWEADPEGLVVKDSPSWRAYTGQTLEEWLGYGWLDAIHPDDREYTGRQWRDAVEAKGLVNAEFRMRAPDGTWRWTNVRAAPILDGRGAIEKWVGMNIDIEARKRAERELRESETKFRAVFETMNEACCIFDLIDDDHGQPVDWKVLEANPGYERESGLKNVAGRLASEFMPGTEPYWIEMFGRVAESGKGEHIEKWHEPTGRWIHSSTARVGGPGSKRLASVFFDISDRKRAEIALRESEERLAAAFESVPAGLAVLDLNGHAIIANTEFRRFLPTGHIPSRDAERGHRWKAWNDYGELLSPQNWPGARALRGESVIPGQQMLYTADDGREIWTNVATAPTFDDSGNVTGVVSVISDIDTLKRAEEALRDSERHAQTLLAELQHRVRNTLAVVRSIARRTADNSGSVEEMLGHFQGRLDAFSRMQAALVRSPDHRVNLRTMIDDELVAHATRDGAQVRLKGPEVSIEARAAEKLNLAIHELTTNAVKHGALRDDQGRILINWEVQESADGSSLTLEWREYGVDRILPRFREGFGMELLTRSLPYDVQGSANLEFTPSGVRFEIRMPLNTG